MKKLLALIASLTVASSIATAAEFDGFMAGFNVNQTKADTRLIDPAGPFDGSFRKNSTVGTVFGQYGYIAAENVVLSVGASYDLNDAKMSDSIKLKNHFSIYFEPGYIVDKNTMIYGKVAYHAAKLAAEDSGSVATANMNGSGYGIGVRHKLDKQLFVQAEWEQVKYSKATIGTAEITPKTPSFKVGIGYQF